MRQQGRTAKGLLLFIATMLQPQAHARAAGGPETYGSSSPPKLARRHVSSERARPLKSRPIFPHPPPIPPVQEKQQSIYGSKRLVLKTLASDALPGSWPWTAFAVRTRETHYDVQITLDAHATTRFKRYPPSWRAQDKMEIRFGGGDTEPHGRWFCARSFKTAVGSRLKDPEASEGLA